MKRNTPRHAKVWALMERLGLQRYQAVGLLESLWHLTAQNAPRGDIGRFTDAQIASEIDWERDPGQLVAALVETGWVERHTECRLWIHDWPDHADQAVRRSQAVVKQRFFRSSPPTSTAASSKLVPDASETSVPEPEPEPEPVPVARSSGTSSPEPDRPPPGTDAGASQPPLLDVGEPTREACEGEPPAVLNPLAPMTGEWDEKIAWWEADGGNVQAWAATQDPPMPIHRAVVICYRRYLKDHPGTLKRPHQDAALWARRKRHGEAMAARPLEPIPDEVRERVRAKLIPIREIGAKR